MKRSKLLIVLCTTISGSYAQTATMIWSTYYGGTGIENGYSVAGDASGNVYLAGNTQSTGLMGILKKVLQFTRTLRKADCLY